MASCLLPLIVLAIISATVFHDDGGKWFVQDDPIGTDIVSVLFVAGLLLLTAYTILYYARGWFNNEKWGIK